MKRYQITFDGRTFDVQLLSDPRQERVQVEVDGRAFTVEVKAVPAAGEPSATANAPAAVPIPVAEAQAVSRPSAKTVTAPLPGTIKSIAVQPEQRVAKGAQLLVIEAMKMDNVIRAVRDGVIGAVYVTEGHQVAYGEPLLAYRE
jgi:biotin carboxyl carrier protein